MVRQIAHFDPESIMRSGQCFRMERVAPGAYAILARDRRLLLRRGDGGFAFSCGEDEFNGFWASYLDLETDYGQVLSQVDPDDPFLSRAAHYGAGLRILRQDPWEVLISFIISQRKSIPAIRDCVNRLCAAFGAPMGEGLYAFPTPEALAGADEAALAACALGYRTRYVLGSARAVAAGALEGLAELDDGALERALTSFPGVGVKVANCAMLFGYHRLAASPVDVWIQRVIDEHYAGVSPFPRYGDCAGVMQQYMFFYRRAEAGRGL